MNFIFPLRMSRIIPTQALLARSLPRQPKTTGLGRNTAKICGRKRSEKAPPNIFFGCRRWYSDAEKV
jgi:hypothetical protein